MAAKAGSGKKAEPEPAAAQAPNDQQPPCTHPPDKLTPEGDAVPMYGGMMHQWQRCTCGQRIDRRFMAPG